MKEVTWIALVATALAGCDRPATTDGAPAATTIASEAPEVLVAGCASVRIGPICEVTPEVRALAFHVVDTGAVTIRHRGETLASEITEARGGRLARVTLPPAASTTPREVSMLEVTVGAAPTPFRLAVVETDDDPRFARVRALRKEGKLAEAKAALPPEETLPAVLHGRARSLAARVALALGETSEAIAGFTSAMATHRAEGRASDEVLDAMALSHTLLSQNQDIAGARAVLEQVATALESWDEGRAQIGYYRAIVLNDAGDLRGALAAAEESSTRSDALGLKTFLRRSTEASARLRERMGDADGALALRREAEVNTPPDAPSCERAEAATNRIYGELMLVAARADRALARRVARPSRAPAAGLAMRGTSSTDERPDEEVDPKRLLADAGEVLERFERDCPRTEDVINARMNVALVAFEAGDLETAKRTLRAVRTSKDVPAFVAIWLLETEARLAILRGAPDDALRAYRELADRAVFAGNADAVWQATVGMGEAAEAASRLDAAITHYTEAERLLDAHGMKVPLNDGRASYLAGRDRSVRRLVDALLRTGRPELALAATRRARSRALEAARQIDQVEGLSPAARAAWDEAMSRYVKERAVAEADGEKAWSVPRDELPRKREEHRQRDERARAALDEAFAVATGTSIAEPTTLPARSSGTLRFTFQISADARRIHVFAETDAGLRFFDVAGTDISSEDSALGRAFLEPLDAEITAASAVSLLVHGPLVAVDFHALPVGGKPLLERVRVSYSLDLPESPVAPRGDGAALIVGDTRDNLPRSREEAARVATALESRFTPIRLVGAAATRSEVAARLSDARYFHFAGHALFDGRRPWDSHLELAGNTSLRAGDVLALPAAPSTVVLSGCETARSTTQYVADMSLAHAFLARGSRTVIAAARPIDDTLAATIVERAYAVSSSAGWDVTEGFRTAQLSAAKSMPESDWRAYRLIVR